jgi:hypothetical protein
VRSEVCAGVYEVCEGVKVELGLYSRLIYIVICRTSIILLADTRTEGYVAKHQRERIQKGHSISPCDNLRAKDDALLSYDPSEAFKLT